MKKPIQISIPTPCHENWQQMTPVEKGRFCGSCRKNVIDFTKVPDKQIITLLTSESDVCGRFRNDQLERELSDRKGKSIFWTASAAVISFFALGTGEARGQDNISLQNIEKTPEHMIGDTIIVHKKYRISGTLKDINAKALAGEKIGFHNKPGCIVTDEEGKFFIDAIEGEEIGLETPEGRFIIMDANPSLPKTIKVRIWATRKYETMGLVATLTEKAVKKRTFFGRIFHSIGNLFR